MVTLTAPQLDAIARDVQRTAQVSQIARCLKSKLAVVSARAKQQNIKQQNLSKPAAAVTTKDTWSLSPSSPAPHTTWSSPGSCSSSPPDLRTTHSLSPYSQIEEPGLHNDNDGDGDWMPVRSKRGFELAFENSIHVPAKPVTSMPMSMPISVPAHSFMTTSIHSSPPPSGLSPAFVGMGTIIRSMAVPRSRRLDLNLAGSVHGNRHIDQCTESHITKHQSGHYQQHHEYCQSQVTKKSRTQLNVRPRQLPSRLDQSYLQPQQLHSPCISLHPQPPSTPPRATGLQRPISWSYPPDPTTMAINSHNDNDNDDDKENKQDQDQDKTGTAAGLLMYLATSPLPLTQPRRRHASAGQTEARPTTVCGVPVQSQTSTSTAAATQTAAAADACSEGSLASTPRSSYYHGNHRYVNTAANSVNNAVGSSGGYASNSTAVDTPGTVLFNEYVNVATPPTVNSINASTTTNAGKKNIKSTYLESAMLYQSRMMLDSTTSLPSLSHQQPIGSMLMGGNVIMTGQTLLQK